ncbi:class I SAM-dependent methyltransferase [Sorangium sp. So ce1024]|uniref:class I SAM-dependent methyltransferase n=1 Tax=Sorangium sp. So ce1024 TaxID=3133327 RepID=UPI003F11B985
MPLVRVLEPEVMDTDEDALAYDSMDHAAVNTAFCDALLSHDPDLAYALDVGTGTCLLPIALCRRAPTARIKAIDLSTSMLALGRAHVEQAGLTDAIALAQADAKALPEPDETFSAVLSNSIVHHIPEPMVVLREMVRVLRPGGLLFVRDLVRPETEASVASLVATYAANDTAYQRDLFDASLRAALSLEEVREMLRSLQIPPECAQMTSDRHWTLAFRKTP